MILNDSWGSFKIINYFSSKSGNQFLGKHICIHAGSNISYQVHAHLDVVGTFVNVTGKLVLDGKVTDIKNGDVVYIRKGQKHAVKALTDLHFVEVQMGDRLIEEDIERIKWSWK